MLRCSGTLQIRPVTVCPASLQVADHAHGFQHFGITQLALQKTTGFCIGGIGGFRRRQGAAMAKPSQCGLNQRKHHARKTQPRVQEEQHGHVNGRPGRVKEGKDAITREELADLNQVAE